MAMALATADVITPCGCGDGCAQSINTFEIFPPRTGFESCDYEVKLSYVSLEPAIPPDVPKTCERCRFVACEAVLKALRDALIARFPLTI